MKAKVLNSFVDKDKGVIQYKGQIIEVNKKRFEQLNGIHKEPLLEEIKSKED